MTTLSREALRSETSFAGNDADAAYRHVRILMCQQDGWANALISTTSRVRPVNSREHRDTGLRQLGMPVKWRAGATTVGVKLLLLGQFCAAAIDQPDERNV